MNNKFLTCLIFSSAFIISGCSKDDSVYQQSKQSEQKPALKKDAGATQIAGIGFFDATDACNSSTVGATFAVTMTGDLVGCLYVFVDDFECSPSGTYREEGREYFVGTYKGKSGTFWTDYKFEAKYEGCAVNGSYLGLEIFGRCQHPIVAGSGTGGFKGITGRLDLKDDIEAGNYPYSGHLRF